jgi:hypothetical protein
MRTKILIKTGIVIAALFGCLSGQTQDSAKLRRIDSLVAVINTGKFTVVRDTISKDQPAMGIWMKTYLTMITDGSELKKYVNEVHATIQDNGTTRQMHTENAFYFDQNQLIKVEEFGQQGEKRFDMLWYYADQKPIHYTSQSERAQERAELLLKMATEMRKSMGFK